MNTTLLEQKRLLADMDRELAVADALVVFAPEIEVEDELQSLAIDAGGEHELWDASSVRRLQEFAVGG